MSGIRVTADEARACVAAAFVRAGLGPDEARTVAEALVWAEARGIGSHGLGKVARYLELLGSGAALAEPPWREVAGAGAMAACDAGRALGPVALARGMDRACALARAQGIGWVSVRNTVHTGAVGYFAEQAARQGLVGLVLVGGMPNMAYPGALGAAVATSPIAIAVPTATGEPILLDMATATIALGRIAHHRRTGEPLPAGAATDAAGLPTTDPALATMPTPLGGAKGAGLSLMIELLTGVLAGAPILAPVHQGGSGARRHRQNAALLALDPAFWGDPAAFRAAVAECAATLKGLPAAAGEAIRLPGERGAAARQSAESAGLAVPAATWAELRRAAGLADPALQQPSSPEPSRSPPA
jgi:ureidoglycolate dehydrogenase (NAD+)